MGPHGGLSLWGGTGCPAPHWNMEQHAILLLEVVVNSKSTSAPVTSSSNSNNKPTGFSILTLFSVYVIVSRKMFDL